MLREGGLVLQGGPAREEGVLEVVVEHAADGRHVDVSEARQAAGEVGGVVVGPEEAPELPVEDVLCLRPAGGGTLTPSGSALIDDQRSGDLRYLMVSLSLVHSLTTAWDAGSR